jgi:hypothetical protein
MNEHAGTRAWLGAAGEIRPGWVRRFFDVWTRRRGQRGARPRGSAERRHARVLRRALRADPIAGNRSEILIDGPQTHNAMFDAIATARDHINIESYILEDAGPGSGLKAFASTSSTTRLARGRHPRSISTSCARPAYSCWNSIQSIRCGIRFARACICGITASC